MFAKIAALVLLGSAALIVAAIAPTYDLPRDGIAQTANR